MDDFDRANRTMIRPNSGISKHIADEVGVPYQYFLNKWNPNYKQANPSVYEWRNVLQITGDVGPLKVLAFEHGYELVKIEQQKPEHDLMKLHMEFSSEIGEALVASTESLMDGQVDLSESLLIEKELIEAAEKINQYIISLRTSRGE